MEGLRECNGVRIAVLRQFVDLRAAGIGITHDAGNFIEGLSCRVVPRLPQQRKRIVSFDFYQLRMAPRHDQSQKGRLQIGMAEEIGKNMSFHMVDADQGLIQGKAQCLSGCDADQQRSD